MSDIRIERVGPGESMATMRAIARLHLDHIHHGALAYFDAGALARLYSFLLRAPETGVWVARTEGRIVGFATGCLSIRRAFSWVIRRFAGRLAIEALRQTFNFGLWRRLPSVLAYPLVRPRAARRTVQDKEPGDDPELLSIAVDESARGCGVGRRLVEALEHGLMRPAGVAGYRVATNREDNRSNTFYRALGFTLVDEIPHHTLVLCRYRKGIEKMGDAVQPEMRFGSVAENGDGKR